MKKTADLKILFSEQKKIVNPEELNYICIWILIFIPRHKSNSFFKNDTYKS